MKYLVAWISKVKKSNRGGFLEGAFIESEAHELADAHMTADPNVHAWAVERPEFKHINKPVPKEKF